MIGVFDSGTGGLTILRALTARLPERDFLYLGDHAHAPYGERPAAEIVALTREAVAVLFGRGCRLVVLACNTAAAVALRTLQQDWLPDTAPDHRILGVLVPTVEGVTGIPWLATHGLATHGLAPHGLTAPAATQRRSDARTLAVFATRRTVASNAYPEEINKRAPEITLIQHACAGLVHLIEENAPHEILRQAVHGHVAELLAKIGDRKLDTVMLGCTHYPLVEDLFVEALPAGIKVVAQPELVAHSLADYLRRHPAIDAQPAHAGRCVFLTTGDPARVSSLASAFFGSPVSFTALS